MNIKCKLWNVSYCICVCQNTKKNEKIFLSLIINLTGQRWHPISFLISQCLTCAYLYLWLPRLHGCKILDWLHYYLIFFYCDQHSNNAKIFWIKNLTFEMITINILEWWIINILEWWKHSFANILPLLALLAPTCEWMINLPLRNKWRLINLIFDS